MNTRKDRAEYGNSFFLHFLVSRWKAMERNGKNSFLLFAEHTELCPVAMGFHSKT